MKKIATSLLAVLLAVGFAAFTAPQSKSKPVFNNMYRYLGTDDSHISDPNWYEYTTSTTGCPDTDPQVVCIISSPGTTGVNGKPSFTNGQNPRDNEAEGVSVLFEKDLE